MTTTAATGTLAVGARIGATEALRAHLDGDDWSSQTPSRIRILDAFLRLVTVNGFDSVSMRMIAQAVNIKPPSIYAHFPNGKDEILAEALRWYFDRFGRALLEAVDETVSPVDFWDAMVRVHFVRQMQLPESNLWDLLVATDRTVQILPDSLREQINVWVGLHEDMYQAAAADMGYADAKSAVRVVVALLESATRWNEPIGAGQPLPDDTVDRAIRLSRAMLHLQL
jgi:AcrR family transcriptional regulator